MEPDQDENDNEMNALAKAQKLGAGILKQAYEQVNLFVRVSRALHSGEMLGK